jgi:hypothetical protein
MLIAKFSKINIVPPLRADVCYLVFASEAIAKNDNGPKV